jgi:hypothetical protein
VRGVVSPQFLSILFGLNAPGASRAAERSGQASGHFLCTDDYLRHGTFRFDARLVPFRSYLDDPISEEPWFETQDFDLTREELESASWRSSLPGIAPEHEHWFRSSPITPDWIFDWRLVEYYARGASTPRAWEKSAGLDSQLQQQAESWLTLGSRADPNSAPSQDVRVRFATWIGEVERQTSRNFDLLRRVVWQVVQLHAASGSLDRVPKEMVPLVDQRPTIAADRYARVTHLILGHGSSDHTAVQPSERSDKVLLLKIDFGDDIFAGSEGAMHFWISPRDLAQQQFGAVELTC